MRNSFVLQHHELDTLLASLAPSRDEAGEKYEDIRRRLIRYFEGRHCVPADQYVDETIDRVAKRIAAGEHIHSVDPCRYFYGVAKNVCLEELKQRPLRPEGRPPMPILDVAPSPRLSCLNSCLSDLTPRARELLEAYYLGSRAGLAAREGITPNALRLRIFKEKQKLRTCIARCIQDGRC
jgi:DNA-directed RNA polymerase specialized sigma24 family protein